mgnify:CR=1 FL=1
MPCQKKYQGNSLGGIEARVELVAKVGDVEVLRDGDGRLGRLFLLRRQVHLARPERQLIKTRKRR